MFVQVFECGIEEALYVESAVFIGQGGFERMAQRTLPRALSNLEPSSPHPPPGFI